VVGSTGPARRGRRCSDCCPPVPVSRMAEAVHAASFRGAEAPDDPPRSRMVQRSVTAGVVRARYN
jgi:hypothetical protein